MVPSSSLSRGCEPASRTRALGCPRLLDADAARSVATVLQGLATPSRVLVLDRLRSGPQTVGALTEAVGMGQSAVPHQLRHLRDLGFVAAERDGRHITYRLLDDHIGDLIDQALSHADHLRLAGEDDGADGKKAGEDE